jgi:pilus assembly protein CpaE
VSIDSLAAGQSSANESLSCDVTLVALVPNPERPLGLLSELRRISQGRIFVVGPTTDAKLALRALREGADEFLDQADIEAELSAALGRLVTKDEPTSPAGLVIAVLAPNGGAGSSTLAVNLAALLAREDGRCGLLDLKLTSGDLAPLIDLKPEYTLADICAKAERLDWSMLEGALASHACGIRLLAAPRHRDSVGQVTPLVVERVLSLMRRQFPTVVVDVDHSFGREQAAALAGATVVSLVMRLDFTSLANVRRTREYLAELGIGPDRMRIVVNRYGQAGELPVSRAEDVLEAKIDCYLPDDPKAMNRATNHGQPIVLESPSAKVSRALAQWAGKLPGQFAVR